MFSSSDIRVVLVNAQHTKNVPGRKTDVQECQWLMKLHTYGLLRDSFRLGREMAGLRTIWRLRDRHVKEAGRAVQHMQNALTTMNLQLATKPSLSTAASRIVKYFSLQSANLRICGTYEWGERLGDLCPNYRCGRPKRSESMEPLAGSHVVWLRRSGLMRKGR